MGPAGTSCSTAGNPNPNPNPGPSPNPNLNPNPDPSPNPHSVLYCRLTADVRKAMEEGGPLPPAVDLWRRFVHPIEGLPLRQNRVKMIFGLTDTEEPGFSLVSA